MRGLQLLLARWVVPVAAEPIQNGAVLLRDGLIEAVGRAEQVRAESAHVEDFGEAAILPGLINVHAHPELAAFRGLLDDLPFHSWIPALMKCKAGAQLTTADYEVAAAWTCVEAARAGVTTIGATEASGTSVHALQRAGMRGVVYLETFGPAASQVHASITALRDQVDQLARHANDRVSVGVSPHAPYTVSDALYVATAAYAAAESLPLATHAAEAETEELLIREGIGPFAAGLRARGIATPQRGRSTIELLDRLGVLERRPLLIHCVRSSADDLARIADHGCAIAHCPVANARLGHGIAPVVEALAAGITVGVGTDSVASNNRIDLLEEARIAQILQRARLAASGTLPADQLLRLVTIDAARALGLDARTGSIEPGKDADLCVLALDAPHARPGPSVLNTIFHAARGSDVRRTIVQGRVVFDGAGVPGLPAAELAMAIDGIADRLRRARAEAKT